MSSLRLVSSRLKSSLLNSKTNINRIQQRGAHYAETGGNYRCMIAPVPENHSSWILIRMITTYLWFHVFYNAWWDPCPLLGHPDFQPPNPLQFTDEELGLPPEGEDDILFE